MLKKLLIAVAATWSCSAFALVAPWYQYSNKLIAFLGHDSCLTIDFPPHELEPSKPEEPVIAVTVKACTLEKAHALSKLLENRESEWRVRLDIQGPEGQLVRERFSQNPTLESIQETFDAAFAGHPLFKRSLIKEAIFGRMLFFAEFSPSVVQWYMDDISDLYGFHSEVAAKVCDALLNMNYYRDLGLNVFTTTTVAESN